MPLICSNLRIGGRQPDRRFTYDTLGEDELALKKGHAWRSKSGKRIVADRCTTKTVACVFVSGAGRTFNRLSPRKFGLMMGSDTVGSGRRARVAAEFID